MPQEFLKHAIPDCLVDANPGWQGPCVVAMTDKFTWTTEILWGKRDDRDALSVEERAGPFLSWTGFYCFSGHITLRMVLIYYAQVPFRCTFYRKQKRGRCCLHHRKRIFANVKGKVVELVTLVLRRFSIDFRKLL